MAMRFVEFDSCCHIQSKVGMVRWTANGGEVEQGIKEYLITSDNDRKKEYIYTVVKGLQPSCQSSLPSALESS